MRSPIIGTVVALTFLGTSRLTAQTAPQEPFRPPVYDSLLLKSRTMDISPLVPNCPMPVMRSTPDSQPQNDSLWLSPFSQRGGTRLAPTFGGCLNPLDLGPPSPQGPAR